MKISREDIVRLVALAGVLINAAPANAQSSDLLVRSRKVEQSFAPAMMRVPNRPEQVRWYKAPLQLQIVDPRPILTDTRRSAEQPIAFDIPIAPMPDGVVSGSATPLGNTIFIPGVSGIRTSNPMVSNLPNLQHASFGSNIPPGGLMPSSSLPAGRTTNMLFGKMCPPAPAAGSAAPSAKRMPAGRPPVMVAKYSDPGHLVASASASGAMHTTTSVSAKLKRGQLLSGNSRLNQPD